MTSVHGGRYTSVCIGDREEETVNFATTARQIKSLYGSSTVASISEDLTDDEGEKRNRTVTVASDSDVVAVGIGGDLTLFSFRSPSFLIATLLIKDVNLVSLAFLADGSLVAALASDGELLLVSVTHQTIAHRIRVTEKACSENCFMTAVVWRDRLTLCVALDDGDTVMVVFSNFWSVLDSFNEGIKDMNLKKAMESLSMERGKCQTPYKVAEFVQFYDILLLSVSSEENAPLYMMKIDEKGVVSSKLQAPEGCGNVVRIRHYPGAHLAVALTSDCRLLMLDSWTLIQIEEVILCNDELTAKDFILLDMDDEDGLIDAAKIVLLVQSKENFELQIRQVSDGDVIFAMQVLKSCRLVDTITTEESMILFLEAPDSNKKDQNGVNLRAISACQPEKRFERLLERQQFDEAEIFANEFGLSIERVNMCRVQSMMHFVASNFENKQYLEFKALLEKISDQNWVCDICLACFTLCPNFDYARDLLDYAASLKVTDVEANHRLQRLRYNLQSYREVFSPLQVCLDESTIWSDFVNDNVWEQIFGNLCRIGHFAEARILFCRYRRSMEDWIKTKDISDFLTLVYDAVVSNEGGLTGALDLAEHEIIPVALLHDPEKNCLDCVKMLRRLGDTLERDHPECFPENALNVASTIDRVVDNMLTSCSTSSRQAEIACMLSKINIDSIDMGCPMGELNIYVKNLREMLKLKEVYQLCISYNTFLDQTPVSVCYMLLNRVQSIQLIRPNIEKYAKPYMKEYKLDCDQTLFSYISNVAEVSTGVVSSSNPWDERCLAVADMITSLALRSKAVINVAKRVYPPWTSQLTSAIKLILNDPQTDHNTMTQLQQQCHRAAIGEIFMRYHIPYGSLDKILSLKSCLLKILKFMWQDDSIVNDTSQRLADALKVVKLTENLGLSLLTDQECIVYCCSHLMKHDSPNKFCNLIQFVNALSKDERTMVIKIVLDNVLIDFDAPIMMTSKVEKERRLPFLDAALCISLRFLEDIPADIEFLEKLRVLWRLQNKYSLVISPSALNDREFLISEFEVFLKKCFDNESSTVWNELLRFADALTLKVEELCSCVLNMALRKKNPVAALEFARFAFRHTSRLSQQVAAQMLDCCSYAMWVLPSITQCDDLNSVLVVMEIITEIIGKIVENIGSDLSTVQLALRISQYVGFFNNIAEQCLAIGKPCNEASSILGMHPRDGIYCYKSDGTLFDKISALKYAANIAPSIVVFPGCKYKTLSISAENYPVFCQQMCDSWILLFQYLSMNNQILLEFQARIIATQLPFNEGTTVNDSLLSCVSTYLERALAHRPADLTAAVTLLFSLTSDTAKRMLIKLKPWATARKSPRIMISLIYLTWFRAYVMNDHAVSQQLSIHYAKNIWIKKLGKLGAKFPKDISSPAVVAGFVNANIAPDILLNFCDDFMLNKSDALKQYIVEMAFKGCSEAETALINKRHGHTTAALELLGESDDIFMLLYACMMSLCPYNYEMIELMITEMGKRVQQEDTTHANIMRRSSLVLRFIFLMERINAPTDVEVRWYRERSKYLSKKGIITSQTPLEDISSNINDSGLLNNTLNTSFYEKPDVVDNQLPEAAKKRLPFHPFLFDNDRDVLNILLPIIHAEVTIYNVNVWKKCVREIPEMNISKSDLTSTAILKYIQTYIKNGAAVDENDVELIRYLIYNVGNRQAMIKVLISGFKHIPLTLTKLRFLSLAIEIINSWLVVPSPPLEKPITDAEKPILQRYLSGLVPAYRKYGAEYILKNHNLLNQFTSELLSNPEELLIHIYSKEIDWNCFRDTVSKIPCVEELAANYAIDLLSVQNQLIHSWLDTGSSTFSSVAFDPNDTVSDVDLPSTQFVTEEIDLHKLPYMDASVSRIVHLSRLRDPDPVIHALSAILMQNDSAALYELKIRCVCCLLRILRVDDFKHFLNSSVENLCSNLELLLYARLMDACKVDLTLETFRSTDKQIIVKSLMSNNIRQTPRTACFATHLIIDYRLTDPEFIERLATTLCAERRFEMLAELLRFLVREEIHYGIEKIFVKWKLVAEWMYYSIDWNSPSTKAQFQNFIYFAISCPVEYNWEMQAIQQLIDSEQFPAASLLLDVAAFATKVCDAPKTSEQKRSGYDLPMKWLKY